MRAEMEHNKNYWEQRYINGETGWDTGSISESLKKYIDQLSDKEIKILIPGCGSAYEAEYLHELGFSNVVVIDIVEIVLNRLLERTPDFPKSNVILGDFFMHDEKYDLIIEQTFFSSIPPNLRNEYVEKTYELLNPGGKLSGVLFDFEMDAGPPYGGTVQEHEKYFKRLFNIRTLETCYNSSETWQDIELFIIFEKN